MSMSFAPQVAAAAWYAVAAIFLVDMAHAYNATVSYNITVSDMSPLVRYDPGSAWNVTYSNTPEYQRGMYGVGESMHNAFGPSPSVSLEFVGTSLRVFGGLDNGLSAPFDWKVDDQIMPQPNFDTGRFSPVFGRLAFGHHQFSLNVAQGTPAGAHLMLSEFQLRTAIDSDASNPGDVRCNTTLFSEGTLSDNSVFKLAGKWNITQTFGGWAGQSPIAAPTIIAGNAPSITIYPPPGTSFFKLNGTVGPDYGQYNVAVDPEPPYPYSNNAFSATNAWLKQKELLYALHLEPSVQYTITVSGDKDPTKFLGLNGAEFCYYNVNPDGEIPAAPSPAAGDGSKASGGDSNSGSGSNSGSTQKDGSGATSAGTGNESKAGSTGTVAGGVVGGVAGAALLAGLAWWMGKRQGRKAMRNQPDTSMFSVDGSVMATPFHSPPHLPPPAGAAGGKHGGFPLMAMGPAQGGYQTIEAQRVYAGGQQLSHPSTSSSPTTEQRPSPITPSTSHASPTTGVSSPPGALSHTQSQDYISAGSAAHAPAAGPSSPISRGYEQYKSMLLRGLAEANAANAGGAGDAGDLAAGSSKGGASKASAEARGEGGSSGNGKDADEPPPTPVGAAYALYKNMLLRRQEQQTPTSTLNPLLHGHGADGVHHAEDAGGFPSTLPPVYNPNWRPDRDRARASRVTSPRVEIPPSGSMGDYFTGANRV